MCECLVDVVAKERKKKKKKKHDSSLSLSRLHCFCGVMLLAFRVIVKLVVCVNLCKLHSGGCVIERQIEISYFTGHSRLNFCVCYFRFACCGFCFYAFKNCSLEAQVSRS